MVTPPSSNPKSDTATPQAIADRWALVTARDVMRSDVITVPYAMPLSEVERILSDNRISGVPVTNESGHIVGIVTLRDIVHRYAEDPDARPRRGPDFFHMSSEEELDDEDYGSVEVPSESEETAGDLMTVEVYDVPVDAGLRTIAATMSKHRIHRVLVQENGKHVGLISTMEILDALNA